MGSGWDGKEQVRRRYGHKGAIYGLIPGEAVGTGQSERAPCPPSFSPRLRA